MGAIFLFTAYQYLNFVKLVDIDQLPAQLSERLRIYSTGFSIRRPTETFFPVRTLQLLELPWYSCYKDNIILIIYLTRFIHTMRLFLRMLTCCKPLVMFFWFLFLFLCNVANVYHSRVTIIVQNCNKQQYHRYQQRRNKRWGGIHVPHGLHGFPLESHLFNHLAKNSHFAGLSQSFVRCCLSCLFGQSQFIDCIYNRSRVLFIRGLFNSSTGDKGTMGSFIKV